MYLCHSHIKSYFDALTYFNFKTIKKGLVDIMNQLPLQILFRMEIRNFEIIRNSYASSILGAGTSSMVYRKLF